MKTVLILGAGASADAGVPLMDGFLDRARELLEGGELNDCKGRIIDVLTAAHDDLLPLHAKANLQVEGNVEDLISAIDMGVLIQKYGERDSKSLNDLRDSAIIFLCRTIEQSMGFPIREGYAHPTQSYDALAEIVAKATKPIGSPSGIGHEVSIVTFNYDIGLELALRYHNVLPDYGLKTKVVTQGQFSRQIKVLKLHGSINWGRCSVCGAIVPTVLAPQGHIVSFPGTTQKNYYFPVLQYLSKVKHTDGALEPLPFIVPPTWNKTIASPELRSIWQQAAAELGSAENIVVVGFSLPDTDRFFRYLFALGVMSKTRLRKFLVLDPDPNVHRRFEALTGSVTRGRFAATPTLFSHGLNTIRDLLR